ncbi:MAG: tape measure protein [Gammaproteobacteria bacterium]|nr:tape measure protein [Gammaproteobacteria bacterium]MBU2295106.1 tape measure protein [Gammaproteobacteria bacterium]
MAKGSGDAAITSAVDRFGVAELRKLRAQLVALDADYRRLTKSGVLSARERIAAEIQYQAQVNRTRAAIRELQTGSEQIGGNLQDMATKLAAVVAAAYSIERGTRAFFDIADSVVTMEDRLRGAVATQDEYDRSLARLEETSKRVRIPLAQTTELFIGAVGPLREMGFSAAAAADMVAALSAGLVTSNVKGEQAEAMINQLSKGLQTGTIRGEAFTEMLTKAPTLINALTTSLGVSRSELIRMAEAGELTTERFVTALSKQSEELLNLADNMRNTVGDARTTNTDSINKVVGAIDTLTGASEKAIDNLDLLSTALDKAATGDSSGVTDFLSGQLNTTGLFSGFSLWIEGFKAWSDSGDEAAEKVVSAEETAASRTRELNEQALAAKRAYADEFNSITDQLTIKFKNALDDQVAAQRKANAELGKARKAQLDTEKRYQDALSKLGSGGAGPASFNNAQSLQVAARQSLRSGDIEGAKRNAQAALDMLLKLSEAGENTYGFEGMIKGLQAIEQESDQINADKAEKSFEAAREKTREWKKELEALKDFQITPNISDEALAKEAEKLRNWAKMIGLDIAIAPRVLPDGAPQPGGALGAGITAPQKSVIFDPKANPPVPVEIKPVGVAQITKGELPPVEVTPKWVQDGNSYSDGPLEVAARPKWVQDGNSFTDAPPVDVQLQLDQESATVAQQAVEGIAQDLQRKLQLQISIAPPTSTGPSGAPSTDGFAGGGWTGPGSKYKPAGIVHADEHVQPKRVVNEPGALSFLEQIRRNGFRNTISQLQASMASRLAGYAEGGPVSERALPAIPTMNPALMAAAGPDTRVPANLYLYGDKDPVSVMVEQDSFGRLLRRTALKNGRPSRS